MKIADDDLRQIGLSRQKVGYLKNICEFFIARPNIEKQFLEMSDDEVIRQLVIIKGVGSWTAEMFLIFHLQRPDVFPVKDLGVQKAMKRLHPNLANATPDELLIHAAKWQPYRTVATWYLWRSLGS